MTTKTPGLFDRLFKNKTGQIIIWQYPNTLLWGWIVVSVAGFAFKYGRVHSGLHHLSSAFLLAWAYLEIRSGESMFRRILGIVVAADVLYGFFKVWL